MKFKQCIVVFAAATIVMAASGDGLANDEDLEVTITVVGEDEDPQTVFEVISLPASAAPKATENSQRGLETANQARENGKAFGQAKADEAKEKGKAAKNNASNAAANAADQNQENIKDIVSSKVPEAAQGRIPTDVLNAIKDKHKPEPPDRGRGNN
jgi:hypothetical protein